MKLKNYYTVYRWLCEECVGGAGEFHDNGTNIDDKCDYCDAEYNRKHIIQQLSYAQWFAEAKKSKVAEKE